MKALVLLFAALWCTSLSAQETYLKIYKTDEQHDQIMYPPGTKFEVRDAEGNLLFNETNYSGEFQVNQAITLTVRPNYKNDADVYELSEGKIELAKTKDFFPTQPKKKKYHSYGVEAKKEVSNSKILDGMKNLTLTFSNGVIFNYIDGKASASLHGESLKIKGKYLVYSELGVAKVSFNPSTGTTWYVFEPK